MQTAYIVHINPWPTIEERILLWQEIIDSMPDCQFQYVVNETICTNASAHAAISEHMKEINSVLASFVSGGVDGTQSIYIPISGRWERRPEWLSPQSKEHAAVGGSVRNAATHPTPFSSFENCVQYLKERSESFKQNKMRGKFEPFDRYRIGKTSLDSHWGSCYEFNPDLEPLNYFLNVLTLDGNYEPINIEVGWHENVFEDFVLEIPYPFESGDILIDVTECEPFPFVFDRCVSWTLEDREDTEIKERIQGRIMDLEECELAILNRCFFSALLYYAHGSMYVYGYKIGNASDKSLLEYDGLGVSDNYLNLEYYHRSFDGKLFILPIVSWFVMNENRLPSDPLLSMSVAEDRARRRFKARGIDVPDASPYDICSLVNTSFRLG